MMSCASSIGTGGLLCRALAAWQADPSKFLGRPKLPRLQRQADRAQPADLRPSQALSAPALREETSFPSQLDISVPTKQTTAQASTHRAPQGLSTSSKSSMNEHRSQPPSTPLCMLGVDIGLNNLATIASDKAGFIPAHRQRSPGQVDQSVLQQAQSRVANPTVRAFAARRADSGAAHHPPHAADRSLPAHSQPAHH